MFNCELETAFMNCAKECSRQYENGDVAALEGIKRFIDTRLGGDVNAKLIAVTEISVPILCLMSSLIYGGLNPAVIDYVLFDLKAYLFKDLYFSKVDNFVVCVMDELVGFYPKHGVDLLIRCFTEQPDETPRRAELRGVRLKQLQEKLGYVSIGDFLLDRARMAARRYYLENYMPPEPPSSTEKMWRNVVSGVACMLMQLPQWLASGTEQAFGGRSHAQQDEEGALLAEVGSEKHSL